MEKGKVLIIDDEQYQRDILQAILEAEGFTVACAESGKKAHTLCESFSPEVVLCDLKLSDTDGIKIMERCKAAFPQPIEFIIFTAHGSIESAVEAIRKGAFDYLTKPVEREKLLVATQRAQERVSLIKENVRLKKQLSGSGSIEGIIGKHPSIEKVLRLTRVVAPLDATVLITGETGTGKELVAKAIHALSSREKGIFQAINCASLPETLVESELFGYEKGAFTGAFLRKPGLIEMSNDGTLFLDEIGELPPSLQAKLLRFLEEKKIRHLGGKEEITVNVRLIAATNKKLHEEIQKGRFREDLYYRLNGFTIELPPLRERESDIFLLTQYFLEKYNLIFEKNIKGVSSDALRVLMSYPWPGNVRQLDSVIEKTVLLTAGEVIESPDLDITGLVDTENARVNFELPPEGFSLDEFEKEIILNAMEKAGGSITRAAKLLGISYRTMEYRAKKFAVTGKNQPNGESRQPNR